MRNITRPTDEHSEAFDACTSNLTNVEVLRKYNSAKPYVIEAGNDFLNKINSAQVSSIIPTTLINGVEMKDAMMKLYTDKLAKKGQPGRVYYDKWRSLAPNGRCPLCGIKAVSTLDHYLSKSDFPALSIYPFNLIPCCRDCNTEKLAYIARTYAEETLHPYFDNLDDETWLLAEIVQDKPAKFTFSVKAPINWPADLILRIQKHVDVFKLKSLFSSHAAEELSNIAGHLLKLYRVGGSEAVKDHLFDAMQSRQNAFLNSWQTATYTAMYTDPWFHSNGFNL